MTKYVSVNQKQCATPLSLFHTHKHTHAVHLAYKQLSQHLYSCKICFQLIYPEGYSASQNSDK